MADAFDGFSKALIYDNNRNFLGSVVIIDTIGEDVLILRMVDNVIDNHLTDFIITLSSDTRSSVTYKAAVMAYDRYSPFSKTYKVRCKLLEEIEGVQKREHYKIKVSIPAVCLLFNSKGAPVIDGKEGGQFRFPITIKDISATGMFFTSGEELEKGQIAQFLFSQSEDPPFSINAEILRTQAYDDESEGYGCRFINLSVSEESSVRRYIFSLLFTKYKTERRYE